MEAIWQWGITLIHQIQVIQGAVITTLFKAITFMGEELFFFLLIPLFLWCVDFKLGVRLINILLLSIYTANLVKALFAHPRPFNLDATVKLHDEVGYGLPSGHSHNAVSVWGTLAGWLKKKWAWAVAILLMFLIGFSRVFLGVHFPTDVLGGWLLGILFLVAFNLFYEPVVAAFRKLPVIVQLLIVIIPPVGLTLLLPTKEVAGALAIFAGVNSGIILIRRISGCRVAAGIIRKILCYLIGAAGLFLFYLGLKLILPDEGEPLYLFFRFIRYAVTGFWITFAAPLLFDKFKLNLG